MSIQFIICINRQGKLRLSKWYVPSTTQEQRNITHKIHRIITDRKYNKQSNSVNFENNKLVFRKYNGLFFILCINKDDNELSYLQSIPLFVEILDSYFDNVCELDLIFSFYKMYRILDQIFIGGELVETNKQIILDRLKELDGF